LIIFDKYNRNLWEESGKFQRSSTQTHILKALNRITHNTDKGEVGGSSPPRPTNSQRDVLSKEAYNNKG